MKIIAWSFALYVSYCGFLYFFQRMILFSRSQATPVPDAADRIPGLEKIRLDLPFGQVESWFLPPKSIEKPSPVLLFAHGNAELIDHWPAFLHPLTQFGIGVLLVEYPGYGRSEGSPSQESVTATFVMVYDQIVERKDVDPTKIVFAGRSIGGGAVCALAEKRKPAALILMSTFESVRSMAVKFGVPGCFVRDAFDNLNAVRSYDGPVLVTHGRHDDIIPYAHGRKLSQASPNGRLITYECAHNDCPPSWDVFYEDIVKFLSDTGILKEETPKNNAFHFLKHNAVE